MMSDLRDSGSIEQDADVILMLYRDEYYYKEKSKFPGMAEVIVAKQRNGETGTVFLAFNGQYSTFSNYDGIVSEFEED
jgi:replicative DNA helicase